MIFTSAQGPQRALATALIMSWLATPLLADPASAPQTSYPPTAVGEPQMIVPQDGRTIADPANLAPPRIAPPESSLPATQAEPVSLDLNGTITEVLAKSPTLERVLSRIRQAEYSVDEAYTLANPTIGFSTQYSRIEPPVSVPGIGTVSPADNYQFGLSIRQAIYTFGRLKWNALAAKLQQRVVEEDYRTELNRLVQLTAQRYIEALLSQDAVVIAEDNLESQQSNLRTSTLLFEQGVAARFDVLSNSAAVARAQQRLIEAQTAEVNAKARVLSLLDQPLDRTLRLGELELKAPLDIQLPNAKQRALESRPDLRSVRWAVEQAKARVEVAETSNNPTLELQNNTFNRNAAGFNPGTQNTTALVFSVPLYDGGLSKAQADQAQEAVIQLSRDLEQNERDVTLQVEETFNQLIDRWVAISAAEQQVRQADEALRVAVLRYQNGISTNTELLTSQADRSQARFDLATVRANYLQSRWTWWQVTASEYPTEVPFPANIRERMDSEGIPLRSPTQEFSEQPSGQVIGPLLPFQQAPRLPIRGLPQSNGDGISTDSDPGAPGGSAGGRSNGAAPVGPGSSPRDTQTSPEVRSTVPPTGAVQAPRVPGDNSAIPIPSTQPGAQPSTGAPVSTPVP